MLGDLQMNEKLLKGASPNLYVLFPLVVMTATVLVPMIDTIRMSFYQVSFISPGMDNPFVGLDNYRQVLGGSQFWGALKVTVIWTFFSVLFQFLIGFYAALLLHARQGMISTMAKSLFLIPWMLPGALAAIIWKLMYDGTNGLLNHLLTKAHLISAPQTWLSDPATVLGAAIAVNVWRGVPFFIIMIYGGLQTISKDIYEAARIDGANAVQRFIHLTLPELKPLLVTLLIYQAVGAYNYIDIITALTGGGPANHTMLLTLYAWQQAFAANNVSIAATISTLSCLSLVLIGLTCYLFAFFVRKVYRFLNSRPYPINKG
jgi:multiple sugar transport system permease protein